MTLPSYEADVERHYYKMMGLCLAGILAVFISAFLVPSSTFDFYVGESGPVQVFSAAAYLTVVVALWRETGSAFIRRHIYLVIIPVAMCLRELDFHTHFTTMSITTTRFFVSPEVPLIEKVVAIIVYAVLIWCAIQLVVRHYATFLEALRQGRAYAVALVIAASLAVVSKIIDGIGRKLAPLGLDVPSDIERIFEVAEEVMELGIPLFFLIAVFARFPFRAPATGIGK